MLNILTELTYLIEGLA